MIHDRYSAAANKRHIKKGPAAWQGLFHFRIAPASVQTHQCTSYLLPGQNAGNFVRQLCQADFVP